MCALKMRGIEAKVRFGTNSFNPQLENMTSPTTASVYRVLTTLSIEH